MIYGGSRKELEACLIKALSRHIGYTTGAYKLDRTFGILNLFHDKPSVYESEIIELLKENDDLKSSNKRNEYLTESVDENEYLTEVIKIASSMQLIEVVTDRSVRIKRYAPTQTGRAVLGSQQVSDNDFLNFFLTKIVLMADADALVPILIHSRDKISNKRLFKEYKNFQNTLRSRRFNWLKRAFPEPHLLKIIAENITWLQSRLSPEIYKVLEISETTARHHVSPRKEWLRFLNLVDHEKNLTKFGNDVVSAFLIDNEYFWLGPREGVQDELRIPHSARIPHPVEDKLEFSKPNCASPSKDEIDLLIDKTSATMKEAYEKAKLVYAPQASLQIPIEYINFRSYMDRIPYSWQSVLEELFKRNRESLVRFSARKGQVGFYKAK